MADTVSSKRYSNSGFFMMGLKKSFGLNFTGLVGCGGFLLMSLNASHWLSIDSDLVLHIMYGRAVITDGLPSSDPYLSGITDAPILQEWLFELAVAWLDRLLGLAGPLLLFSVLIGLLMAGLFHVMRSRGVCFWAAIVYTILILFTLRTHLIIRPHLVSWCAVFALMLILENWAAGRRGLAFTLASGVLLMLAWTNMHGGFLIGLAITLVFVLDAIYRDFTSGVAEKSLPALGLLAAFTLTSLLNPWGWHLHTHLVAFLRNDFLMAATRDFLPPGQENGALPVFILSLVAVVLPMLIRRREVPLRQWLLLLGLCYAAATSVRNIPFFGLVMLPIAAGHMQSMLARQGSRIGNLVLESSRRMQEDEGENSGLGWPLLAFFTVSILLATGVLRAGLYSENVPQSALEWINERPALHTLPVFADYLLAGYLLYATPVQKVYLHALNANYPAERLQLYLGIANSEQPPMEELHDSMWALIAADSGQLRAFAGSSCWQELYRDDYAVIFRKNCNAAEASAQGW